jgi:DNA-binding response OmpR family regulator
MSRILVIEELREEGYDVIEEGDGMRGPQQIREERPDLIVLDERLGRLSGIELLNEIRRAGSDVPVIVCIACPLLRHSQKCGAEDDYATKTSDLSELKIKIIYGRNHEDCLESRSFPSSVHHKTFGILVPGQPRGKLGRRRGSFRTMSLQNQLLRRGR